VIVCPSCHTRYRQPPELVPGAAARCSRCDGCFPLVVARRAYRVLDGSLGLAAVSCAVGGSEAPRALAAAALAPRPPAPLPGLDTGAGWSTSRTDPEWRSLVLTSVIGAAAGWVLMPVSADPRLWTAGGCLVGVLSGWVARRWNRRHSS